MVPDPLCASSTCDNKRRDPAYMRSGIARSTFERTWSCTAMADYDGFDDDLYQRHSPRRVAQWDDYQDRMSGSIEGSGRGDRRVYMRHPVEGRDPDLNDRSHARDRSWDASDWDTERDDRREQDYDQRSRDRRERDERYRGRSDRDIDESFGDPVEQDLLPDWGGWGEEDDDEMDLNVLPVNEDRRHTFIRGQDDLDNQSHRSIREGRHLGHEDELLPYEGSPLIGLPADDTVGEWNELKSDVPTKTIMISGLPRRTRPAEVYHLLHGFLHEVRDLQLDTTDTGDEKDRVAFIEFFTPKHAVRWMEKTQGSLMVLNCEVKADYSTHVLKSEKVVHTWRNWATTDPTNTLVFWNVPTFMGMNAIRGHITQLGFKPTNIIILKDRKSGESRGYGYIEFKTVAEAVKFMDCTKGVLDMTRKTILVTYSSGGKKDNTYTAAKHSGRTDNKVQMQGAVDDQNDGSIYHSNEQMEGAMDYQNDGTMYHSSEQMEGAMDYQNDGTMYHSSEQMQGAMDNETDGTMNISSLPVDLTMGDWNELKSDVPTKTIMLSGLPRITRPAEVYHLFHGFLVHVQDMQIETSPTGDHEGVAFVDFFTQEHAVRWMEKTQGSVEVLKCEVKADYSSLILKSEQTVHTWRNWATTDPTNTLVFWNVPSFIGMNAIRFQLTESGFEPTKVKFMKRNKPGESRGYGFIEFGSVAEAVKVMDFTQGVLDMIEMAILVTYSSGGKKDKKYTAAKHSSNTDNKQQIQGTMVDQKEGIVYVSNLTPDVTHDMLVSIFKLAGEVRKIKNDVTTATVKYKKQQDAVQAISMLNGMIMLDNKIVVSEEQVEAVKASVSTVKTNVDINLIRTKHYLHDLSTDRYYKRNILKKCPVADCSLKKPIDWKDLAKHWTEIHTPTKKKFTCPMKNCNIGLTHTESHLRTHLQSEHDVKGDNLEKQIKGAKFYLIQNEKYSDPGGVVLPQLTLVKAVNIKIPKTECLVEGCPYPYSTMKSMQQHWARYHRATMKMYTCSDCKGRVLGKSHMQDHLHKIHNVDFDDSKAELVEWKNPHFIDPGDVIPFWSLYTEEDVMNHDVQEKELGEDFPLVDLPLDELEKENPNLYDLYEWTEQYMHRLEVARKYALSDLQELTCKALEED
ncbi:uncharacterized protein [Haliotis asinina]|uniref:uncharacterized protein n=1 Tax=Haliotis asinina TaxID=109174 RepID=UPI0035327D7E